MSDLSEHKDKSFTIPREIVEGVLKNVSKNQVVINLSKIGDHYLLNNNMFQPIECRYPPIDRVMPVRNDSAEQIASDFDFELLAKCQKSMQIATGEKHFKLQQRGRQCGLMHLANDEVFPRCCVMPLNTAKVFKY